MDRGFLDFARLYRMTQARAFFVIRPKSNTLFKRVYSRTVDKTTGLRCDQTVRLTGVKSQDDYPQYLRYVVFYDEKTDKRLAFFTNNFELPALVIAQLYKCRWQVELFFDDLPYCTPSYVIEKTGPVDWDCTFAEFLLDGTLPRTW